MLQNVEKKEIELTPIPSAFESPASFKAFRNGTKTKEFEAFIAAEDEWLTKLRADIESELRAERETAQKRKSETAQKRKRRAASKAKET